MPSSPHPLSQAGAGQHLTANQAPRQDFSNAQVDAMQQRIAFLEKELVDTRLQLVCSKSSEDRLKLELSKMSSAFAKFATGDSHHGDSCSTPLSAESQADDENIQENVQTQSRFVSVPTANPSLLKGKATLRRARRKSIKVLNPGSCSSGIDLLALAELSSTNRSASLARQGKTNLNPGSCASGINFGNYVLAGLNGNYESSVKSMSSVTGLIISTNSKSNDSRRSSNASEVSALGISGVSTANITAMLGSARLLSRTSFSRPQGSRNNVRLSKSMNQGNVNGPQDSRRNVRLSMSMNQGNINGNAEWGVFE